MEQLRGHFDKCLGFVKHNHFSAKDRKPSSPSLNGVSPANSAQGKSPLPPPLPISIAPATSTAAIATAAAAAARQEQFVLMAQKNSALRGEDLKLPPMKHRRISSSVGGVVAGNGMSPPNLGQSPGAGGINNNPSPRTPANQIEVDSPKDSSAKSGRGVTGKGTSVRGGKNMSTTGLNHEGIKNEVKTPSGPVPSVEDVLSKKRKRDQEEAINNPNAFIERTLLGLNQTSFLPPQFNNSQSLPFDFDPVIPPVQADPSPIFFATPSTIFNAFTSNSNNNVTAPTSSAVTLSSLTLPPPSSHLYDFDFFIDSSAAGFVESPFANTPELIKFNEDSPPSDDELDIMKMLNSTSNSGNNLSFGGGVNEGSSSGMGLEETLYSKWIEGGVPSLPSTFSWEGSDLALGSWNFLGDL